MANYTAQQGGDYGRAYAQGSIPQRDAAFSHIFGGAPGPGRSQTMTSPNMPPNIRSQTSSSQTADHMHRAPPVRQASNGYPSPPVAPPGGGSYVHPPQNRSVSATGPRMGPPPPHRQASGPWPPRGPQSLAPPNGVPYGAPQQQPPHQQLPPVMGRPPPGPMPPGRQYTGPGAAPALRTDQFRSQSLATNLRPQNGHNGGMLGSAGGYNSVAPAHTFRQQQYPGAMTRHQTAQGRVVPERPHDRTMSMTNYAREHEYTQMMSGRVVPNRNRVSNDVLAERTDRSSIGTNGSLPNSPSSPGTNQKQRTISQSSFGDRSMSMASTIVSPNERSDSLVKQNGLHKSDSQSQKAMVTQKRMPLVYPALLSRVAQVFRERIHLADTSKDGLDYTNAFSGEDAVTLIAYILKTTDRNLALLLGRSLDAQKFFHDVTYIHRLRDLKTEIYQFRETVLDEEPEVNGVFTLLTECYSPTCTRDRLCYSIACPRRLEQQARLKLKPQPGLKRAESRASLHEDFDTEQKLWINTVSKEVADSIDDREKKRQEVISELMYTERDFVKDLEYLRDFWVKPLQSAGSPIQEHRRKLFVSTVFSNISEVYQVNSKLASALTSRQQEQSVVRNVGDIFLEHVPKFAPFITYGASQLFGKFEFENEKRSNAAFARFVDETERLRESRKLELNGYLTKPTTRLARYPLLLENIAKYTQDDAPDKEDIPVAIKMIKEFLSKVNIESGKAENHFNLMQLSKELTFRPGEKVDLKLEDPNRQLVFKSSLKRAAADQNPDIQVYLFDHAVLLVRVKMVNKREELKVYRKPIPLELLVIGEMDQILPRNGLGKRQSSSLMSGRTTTMTNIKSTEPSQKGIPLTFKHVGKGGYECQLFCSTPIQQSKWIEHVDAQQRLLRERSNMFTKTILNEGFFTAAARVNCCVPIDGARKLVLGTESGVYIVERKSKDARERPRRALECKSVMQIDVLEQHNILLVLTERTLFSFPMEALAPDNPQAAIDKRGRKICHANFFRAGICQEQQLVCGVKTSGLSTTIKAYEPMDPMAKKSKKSGFTKMLGGNQDVLKPLKEIYIPTESTSIHFLRSKLCVGCSTGFEVVSLDTLEAQSLLDQADTSLDFVQRKESSKPIHIERVGTEFLLCYNDYCFFVDRNGWRARGERQDWLIEWEGTPNAFAIFNPYILAFEPNFIEIRHMEHGALVTIITAKNIRMLHSSTREILYVYEDELGEDVIASLDFWKPTGQGQHRQSEMYAPTHAAREGYNGGQRPALENGRKEYI